MKRRNLGNMKNISAAFLNVILPGFFIGHLYIKRDFPKFLFFFLGFWTFIFIYDEALIIFSPIIWMISIADAHKSIKLNELLGKKSIKRSPKGPRKTTSDFDRNFKKGREFEDYVVDRLTPNFDILERDATGKPDLRVISKRHRDTFWVECKYRSQFDIEDGKPGVRWAQKADDERYRGVELASKESVFIMIGLGGKPSKPERMFLFPRSEGYGGRLFEWKIKEYERNPEAVFSPHDFRLT